LSVDLLNLGQQTKVLDIWTAQTWVFLLNRYRGFASTANTRESGSVRKRHNL